jgi:D-psicose/D-tagatose/L-ribulose 3-epimerase
MRISVNTLLWQVDFTPAHLSLLPRLKAHGFEGVEVPVFQPATFDAAAIRKGFAANGLEMTVCSIVPPGLSLIGDDAGALAKGRQHLRDVIKVTADCGARLIAGPLYCPVGYLPGRRRTADEWKRAVESYQSVAGELAANDITIAIEPLNRFETFFLNTSADAAALCDEINLSRVGVSYDTFHSNIEDKGLGAAIRRIGRHVKFVQTSENDRGTPGSGHVAWQEVISALREVGYDGWLTIESFAPNLGDFSSAVCIWRDIEPVTDSIAFDGVRFLKQLINGAT